MNTRTGIGLAGGVGLALLSGVPDALGQQRPRMAADVTVPRADIQVEVQSIEVLPAGVWGVRPKDPARPQLRSLALEDAQIAGGLPPIERVVQADLYDGTLAAGTYWWWTSTAFWGLDDGEMGVPNARSHVNELEFVFGVHADFAGDMLQPQALIRFWDAPADPVADAAAIVVDPGTPAGGVLVTFNPITLPSAGDFLLTSGTLPLPPALQFELDRTFYVELAMGEVQSGFFDPDVFAVFSGGSIVLGGNQDRMWNDQFFFRDTPGNCSSITFGDGDGFYEHPAELDIGQCPLGYTGISPVRISGTPLAELALEVAPGCQADGVGPESNLLTVELWMRNLPEAATGFQAFVEYDDALLAFRDDLSSYTAAPFGAHIQGMSVAEIGPGELNLDGSVTTSGQPATAADNLLATLVFEVQAGVECVSTDFGFRSFGPFSSEFSNGGLPIPSHTLAASSVYLDNTPPDIAACPPAINQNADAGVCTAAVTWTAASVTDNCSVPTVSYEIDLGDDLTVDHVQAGTSYVFPTGSHRVTVRATDDCGNESTCDFAVVIDAQNTLIVEVALPGVFTPAGRCIRFTPLPGDCDLDAVDVVLNFADHDSNPLTPVRAAAAVELPCGAWTSVCAKDEQHTLISTVTITDTGVTYVADATILLDSGDTDNDSDVDINDITWLIAQFGMADNHVGCPWDGVTRDADFSNNGNVGGEDYALLSANFLTLSSCGCFVTLTDGGRGDLLLDAADGTLPAEVIAAADLTGDGVISVDDVLLFETIHGLSGALSEQMLMLEADAAARPIGR